MYESPLVLFSFCLLMVALFEAQLAKKKHKIIYDKTQTELAIGLAIGQLLVSYTVIAFLQKLIHIPPEYKLLVLPQQSWFWGIVAFFSLDFLSYLNHRLSHTVTLFWADHAVHHANKDFNVVTHLAHGWTGFISASLAISFLMNLVGNITTVLLVYFVCAFTVQTLAHTQLIHKMGFLEAFLVTPSNHRVHHAVERETHDSNYGIVFILWDKMFGTFKPEGAKPLTTFGLDNSPHLTAPLWQHAFFGWQDYFKRK